MKKLKYKTIIKTTGIPYLKQNVKGNKVPKNARGGSNGSFICCDPSQLLLVLEDKNGKLGYFDIISVVRKSNDWNRITSKRLDKLKEKLKDEEYFYISDGEIVDIKKIVRV